MLPRRCGAVDKRSHKGSHSRQENLVLNAKSLIFGAPGRIRTHDPLVRSQVLYPTELRALIKNYSSSKRAARQLRALLAPLFAAYGERHAHAIGKTP